jgi:hypothetical protein
MAPTLLGGSITSTSCNFLGNITVTYGTTLNLGMLSYSYNSAIVFDIITSSTDCSAVNTSGCGTYTNGGGIGVLITSAINIAMRARVIIPDPHVSSKSFDYCGNNNNT